jgi:hypothetical protein
MHEIGKALLLAGTLIALTGLAFLVAGRLGLGRLPGDVVIRGRHVTVYLPIATSVLLSLLLTFLFWVVTAKKR